jgi:hypothetical protein
MDETRGDRDRDLLSPMDDHLIHQIPAPVRVVESSDPRVYDRYWNLAHDAESGILITCGGSVYPNLNLVEAYGLVNLRGKHYSVRMSRPLGNDRTDMTVGPLRATVVEPLSTWRFELDSVEPAVRYDLTWRDLGRPRYRAPAEGRTASGHPWGRPGEPTAGFESFGTIDGWVEVAGERLELSGERCRGTRDRHWGIRQGVGGEAMLLGARSPIGGNGYGFVAFDGWSVWGDSVFTHVEGQRSSVARIVSSQRAVRFDDAAQPVLAEVEHRLDDGSSRNLTFERVGDVSTYLRCGFYGGPNGGAPGSDRWQGQLPPLQAPEGEVVDVTTTAGRLELAGLTEHLCLVSSDGEQAQGILQTYDPIAHDLCLRGSAGWSML